MLILDFFYFFYQINFKFQFVSSIKSIIELIGLLNFVVFFILIIGLQT